MMLTRFARPRRRLITNVVCAVAALCAGSSSAQFVDERAAAKQPAVTAAGVPTAPAAAAPAEPLPPPEKAWEIKPTDLRLDRVLHRWAEEAGWRVQWDAARHVELAGPNTFRGSFESAVAQVLATPGIRMSEYPLEGCIYPNTPPLVRITRQGEQVSECPQEYTK